MKSLFISGAYSGTPDQVKKNIELARKAAVKYWNQGYSVVCPHLNSAGMEGDAKLSYAQWVEGYLNLVKICDIIVMLPNWRESSGAKAEHKVAQECGKEIRYLDVNLDEITTVNSKASQQIDNTISVIKDKIKNSPVNGEPVRDITYLGERASDTIMFTCLGDTTTWYVTIKVS